jgi:23S rRNA pseudouridine1911/1915/1917 synthase
MRSEAMTSGRIVHIEIAAEDAGERLDRVLARKIPELSRSRLKALILDGQVRSGERALTDPAFHVGEGDTIAVDVPPPVAAEPQGENIPLDIVHEDDAIIVINKPAGLVVHPAAGHDSGTLVNALIAHCGASLSGIGGVKRPGIVHRLDKDTSGLLVVAKTDRAHQSLTKQFADHGRTGALRRGYLAIAWGAPTMPSGTIDQPIGRHATAREKMAVRAQGRVALTHWRRLETFAGRDGKPVASSFALELETGRTHQIRVHMSHIGHPLLGDATYGAGFKTKASQLSEQAKAELTRLGRQALHAYRLTLEHPLSGEILEFETDWPEDLARLRAALKGQHR